MIDRLWNVLRGMVARFVSNVEASNPEALLELEKENLRVQIVRFNQGLVSHAALAERLVRHVERLDKEQADLHARTRALLQAGKQEAAAKCALSLQKLTTELDEERKQAEEAEQTYQELVRARDAAVEAARDKLESLRRGIDEMRIQQAMSDLNSMAAGLMSSIGGAGESFARLEAMVEEQRSLAAGTSRVARDEMSASDLVAREEESEALANQALADFAAREGLPLGGGGESAYAESSHFDETTKRMLGESEGDS